MILKLYIKNKNLINNIINFNFNKYLQKQIK